MKFNIIKDKNAVICDDFNKPSVNWSTVKADREEELTNRGGFSITNSSDTYSRK